MVIVNTATIRKILMVLKWFSQGRK